MDSANGSRPVRGRGVRRLAARARFDGLRSTWIDRSFCSLVVPWLPVSRDDHDGRGPRAWRKWSPSLSGRLCACAGREGVKRRARLAKSGRWRGERTSERVIGSASPVRWVLGARMMETGWGLAGDRAAAARGLLLHTCAVGCPCKPDPDYSATRRRPVGAAAGCQAGQRGQWRCGVVQRRWRHDRALESRIRRLQSLTVSCSFHARTYCPWDQKTTR